MITLDSSMADLAQRNEFSAWVHLVIVWMMSLDNDLIKFSISCAVLLTAFLAALLTGVSGTLETGWPALLEVGVILAVINRDGSFQHQ